MASSLSLKGMSFTSKKNNIWTFGKIINAGSFGTIYTHEPDKNFLIKTGKESIYFETSVLRKLESEVDNNIPKMIDSGKLLPLGFNDTYFIVMPNYGKSLHSIIEVNPLSQELLKSMMTDMLFALYYINSKKYMHLDVNPKNIVFDDIKKNWCLIDFGLAKNFRNGNFEKDKKYVNHGTPLYMARDAHRGIMSRKCDLESLAYTMIVAQNIHLPWKDTKNKRTLLIQKNSFFKKDVPLLEIPEYQKIYIIKVDMLKPEDNWDCEELEHIFISEMNIKSKDLLIKKTISKIVESC